MPDISISAEQEAYIEALREQLDDEVAYGHVRRQDAVQYLIDHHRKDGDLDVSVGSVEDADVAAEDSSGSPDESDAGADASGSTEGQTATDGSAGASSGSSGPADDDPDADYAGSAVEGSVQALNSTGPGGGGTAGTTADDAGDGTADGDATTGEGVATIGSAQSDEVQQVMSLMDDHSDVWEETESSEGKYRVELPDGSTENVPTKDDVRALLFKHYR